MHLLHESGKPIYQGLWPQFRPFPPLVLKIRGGNCDYTYDGHGMLMESMRVADIIRPKNTVANLNRQSFINMKAID
jgi:hypothetical protein